MLGEELARRSEPGNNLNDAGREASLDSKSSEEEGLERSRLASDLGRGVGKRTARGDFSDDLRMMAFPAATEGPILETHLPFVRQSSRLSQF